MNKLTFVLTLFSFIVMASCSSDTGEQNANATPAQVAQKVAKIDSVTTVLQQTEQELQVKEKALDEALNDLDF